MQIAEPESTRDDAHPIATGIVIIGRVKRLLKIADQIKPERERDQPLAMMVARVVDVGQLHGAAPGDPGL
jgi:hypothetical protein